MEERTVSKMCYAQDIHDMSEFLVDSSIRGPPLATEGLHFPMRDIARLRMEAELKKIGITNSLEETVNKLISVLAVVTAISGWHTAGFAEAKENKPAATITGSGDTGYIPRWTGTTTIGNSLLYQTSGKIGISTTAPDYKLDVNGSIFGTTLTSGGAIVGATLDTGVGANELYPMNQALRTTDNVSFANVSCSGQVSASLVSGGTITGSNLNVGPISATTGLFSGDISASAGRIATGNATYSLEVGGTIRCATLIQTSDERVKYNITTLDDALQKVLELRGVKYEMASEGRDERPIQVGLIAQEVEVVVPEVVYTDNAGLKSIAYDRLVAVLIEAMKQQEKRIADLELAIRESAR